jgi:PKD repeat protein
MGNCQLSRFKVLSSLKPGTYYWSVQAIDQSLKAGTWANEQTLIVSSIIADFTADTVCLGLPTHFTDLSVSSTETISNWQWSFGDTTSFDYQQNPSHIYQFAGEHKTRLVITSQYGKMDTIEKIVFVKPLPDLKFSVNDVCVGTTALITNQTIDNNIENWSWDFGDGQTSSLFDPATMFIVNLGNI